MSNLVFGLVWNRFPGKGGELLTMLALADWAGDDGGRIYPSIEILAAKIRHSERQTRRLLRSLEGNNWIKPVTEKTGGRGKTTHYQMNLETLTKCPKLLNKTRTPATINPDIAMSQKADTILAESAPVSQSVQEPLLTVNNRYRGQPVDNSGKTDITTLQSYRSSLEKLSKQDEGTAAEIERIDEQIRQLIISSGSTGQLEL